MLSFDHLAVSCTVLSDGTSWLEDKLGLSLSNGGKHPDFGTYNKLLSLGPEEYLEVIAINPAAPAPARPRWFGLDDFSGPPRLTNWILRSSDLDRDLADAHADAGTPIPLSRGDLRWRMAVPAQGALPFDQMHPALIGWDGPHPAPRLPDQGVRLKHVRITHPHADMLAGCLPSLDDPRLVIEAGPISLTAQLQTPHGVVTL